MLPLHPFTLSSLGVPPVSPHRSPPLALRGSQACPGDPCRARSTDARARAPARAPAMQDHFLAWYPNLDGWQKRDTHATHVDTRGHGMAFHSRWVACMAFLIISALHWVSRMSLVPFWSSFLRARGAQAYTVSMNEGHYGHWSTEQPGMLVKGGCKP